MPNPKQNLKDRLTYDKITEIYLNKTFSIDKACKEAGITMMTYYRICKRLGEKSIAKQDNLQIIEINKDEQRPKQIDIDSIFQKAGRSKKNLIVEKISISDKKHNKHKLYNKSSEKNVSTDNITDKNVKKPKSSTLKKAIREAQGCLE